MKNIAVWVLFLLLVLPNNLTLLAYDLTREKVCYVVPGAHLDDQWQWTLAQTTHEYVPNTLHTNFRYFEQYSEYKFNFEGAFRYWLTKNNGGPTPSRGYNANDWTTLKSYVQQGRWIPSGAFWSGCDVNIPSAEALIRQALYGQMFFGDEFGKKSNDVYLPDCFGFGYALPSVATHCGLKGFSTSKYEQWGGWTGVPFSIGRWIGVDGSSVIASLKPGDYGGGMDIRTWDGDELRSQTASFANGPGGQPGVWTTYDYAGTGDVGGGPSSEHVSALINRQRANDGNSIKVYTASSGQLFDDLTPAMVAALPQYEGELLLTKHGTGCLTSWAPMKLKNRRNEQRAALAEFAGVAANCFTKGSFAYPQDTIRHAWWRLLSHQFHDDLTGTSIPQAYTAFSLPGLDSSFRDFSHALDLANSAMAQSASQVLSTNASIEDGRVPIVLVNSLSFERTEIVEAVVNFGVAAPAGVRAFDQSGHEVAAQIVAVDGQNVSIAFVATVPSAGYAVYEVKPSAQTAVPDPSLTIDATTGVMENSFYKVTIDRNGDLASIIAKKATTGGQELLSSPCRLEMRPNEATMMAAWEVTYGSCTATPTFVSGNVRITAAESGPARISLKVTRNSGSSQFTQYIQLGAGEAGKRITICNEINWLSLGSLLKAGFPLTCSNPNATWDLGIGTIQRPNMAGNRYEVPGQQWADITNSNGVYGVSILNDCKYGWNKERDNKLNLTLIHSPDAQGYGYQGDLSSVPAVGIHKFTYAIYGHAGSWVNGTVREARSLNQPVYAYQTVAHAGTSSARSVSLLSVDTAQVDVMAIKKAEKSNNYIVRVREAMGKSINNAKLVFTKPVTSVVEVTGTEDLLAGATQPQISGNIISFNLTKYKPRAFSVDLGVASHVNPRLRDPIASSLKSYFTLYMTLGNKRAVVISIPADRSIRRVSITDVAGRHIRDLTPQNGHFYWDGRNRNGAPITQGMYLLRCETSHGQQAAFLSL